MRKNSGKPGLYISPESVLKLFISKQVESHCLCTTESRASLNLFVFRLMQFWLKITESKLKTYTGCKNRGPRKIDYSSQRLKFATSAEIFHVRIWIGNFPCDSFACDLFFCPYMVGSVRQLIVGPSSYLKAEIKIAWFSLKNKMQIYLARKVRGYSLGSVGRTRQAIIKQSSNWVKTIGSKAHLGPSMV